MATYGGFYSKMNASGELTNQETNSCYNNAQNYCDLTDKNYQSFDKIYRISFRLGSGTFGTVYAGSRIHDGLSVAIKLVAKGNVHNWFLENGQKLPLEIALLKKVVNVKGCIKLLDYYESPDMFFIVMERPENTKDLFDFIAENEPLDEDLCYKFFRQVVEITMRCHEAGVVHRDLKEENMLVNLDTKELTLIDFGSGAFLQDTVYNDVFSGTREFCPPEWIKFREYHWRSATVWSLGIMLFSMVCGSLPFEENREICRAKLFFSKSVSKSLRNLIKSMLRKNPSRRLSLEQILEHPWMQIQS